MADPQTTTEPCKQPDRYDRGECGYPHCGCFDKPTETTRPLTDGDWIYWQKLVSDEHDRQTVENDRLRDLLRRWVELDGDRDDIAKLIGETYAEVKLLHA